MYIEPNKSNIKCCVFSFRHKNHLDSMLVLKNKTRALPQSKVENETSAGAYGQRLRVLRCIDVVLTMFHMLAEV